jgi:hypothetical protein
MQIHELTRPTLTEASIADRIKSAASAVKTGIQNTGDAIAANNAAQATAQQQKTQAQAAKYAQTLQRRGYGTAATGPAPTSAVQPGQRIKIVATQPNGTQSNYYKTDKGWENELKQPIKNANSIEYLEKLYAKRPTSAGAVQPTSAGAVQTGTGASAVMTSVDVDQTIRQLGLSQEQLKAFQTQATQNPGFVQAFLKRLGLVR